MEFCTVVELSDDAVGSDLEISFPLVPGEGEMLWSCVQYCQGYDDSLYEKQSDIQQLELFSEPCSESSDDDDDDTEEEFSDEDDASRTSSQEKDKEVKNERERVRIQKKNEALKVIKKLIMASPLISEEAKKKRWTEKYTLELCLRLIENTKREIRRYRGGPSQVPLPLARKSTVKGGVKKAPNSFLQFSKALRPSFLQILRMFLHPEKSPRELEAIQVDNRKVTQFLSAVWRSLSNKERSRKWESLSKAEKAHFVQLAQRIIDTAPELQPALSG